MDECNRPKMAIPIKACKNIFARKKKTVYVHAKPDPNNAHITQILDTIKQKLSVKIRMAYAV